MIETEKFAVLSDYSQGRLGTRETIEVLGFSDYADIIIALAAHDLPFPKPDNTPILREHQRRAHAILGPRLRRHFT